MVLQGALDGGCICVAEDGLARLSAGNVKHLAGSFEDPAPEEAETTESTGDEGVSTATFDAEEAREAPPVAKRTLFLLRHGEAVHNVLESAAKKRAGAEAEALGHAKGSEAYKTMVEMARKAVLHDATQVDPPLSDAGLDQASATNKHIDWLTSGPLQLPEPTAVFVSPLQRTLQTAASVFPDHAGVRVHELVRERRTGLACDEPSPQREMCRRRAFSYMDFGAVLQGEHPAQDDSTDALPTREKFSEDPRRCRSDTAIGSKIEDAAALRLRTAMLGELLRSVEDQAVCVVTHKGYLRELERGPLGQPEATEFGTGEVRVYEVCIAADGSLEATICYRKDLHGEAGASACTSPAKA